MNDKEVQSCPYCGDILNESSGCSCSLPAKKSNKLHPSKLNQRELNALDDIFGILNQVPEEWQIRIIKAMIHVKGIEL